MFPAREVIITSECAKDHKHKSGICDRIGSGESSYLPRGHFQNSKLDSSFEVYSFVESMPANILNSSSVLFREFILNLASQA